ncbi:hypothetical protein [Bradyrhizobium sp. UFLA05-109]
MEIAVLDHSAGMMQGPSPIVITRRLIVEDRWFRYDYLDTIEELTFLREPLPVAFRALVHPSRTNSRAVFLRPERIRTSVSQTSVPYALSRFGVFSKENS